MLARLALALRLRLRVSGIVGTGDPADTAFLFAILRAVRELPGVQLEVQSAWIDEELELDAEGSARVWIIHLMVVAAALLWARENRTALRAIRATTIR
jgi:hypothetical protein